jgi:hypothetical protein
MLSLQFKHGEPLQVHEDLLSQQWRMRVLIPTATKNEVYRQFISRISRSAGHILIQFLYTDRYSPLRWKGPTEDDMVKAASLHIAIEVYATARLFRLSWLECLAKDEITQLAMDVDLFTIIDIVKETYPDVSGNDTWFPTFIKSTMKAALEKPRAPATAATSLDKMLLWGAMEVFRDKLDALTPMTTSAAEQHVPDATPAPRTKKKKKGKSAVLELFETVEEAALESELPAESLSAEVEPVTFPVEEPLVEEDPLPEPEPEGDLPAKKCKKGKKAATNAKAAEEAAELISETLTPSDEPVAFPYDEPLLKEEALVEEKPLPEPEAEVVEEYPTKIKNKKKKKGKSLVKDETLAPIEVLADSPIAKGWVGAESDSF